MELIKECCQKTKTDLQSFLVGHPDIIIKTEYLPPIFSSDVPLSKISLVNTFLIY